MFTSEQLVVYPAQGVGQIERIDSQNIGGSACDFYIVRIRANSITLMVPVKNASNVGLRTLVSTKEAEHIWEALRNNPQQTVHTGQNWNRRFREYSERLKSPDLSIVANVLRELLLIGRTKDLSFGERRLLEQAMSLVTGELGEVLKTKQRDLQSELISLYSRLPSSLRLLRINYFLLASGHKIGYTLFTRLFSSNPITSFCIALPFFGNACFLRPWKKHPVNMSVKKRLRLPYFQIAA